MSHELGTVERAAVAELSVRFSSQIEELLNATMLSEVRAALVKIEKTAVHYRENLESGQRTPLPPEYK